ncbi:hypothetical protein BKA93DRAFT_726748 [Sparassis latifolia]
MIQYTRRDLIACAATCTAWYLRSLANLVSFVVLLEVEQLAGFAKLMTKKPYLGKLVRDIILRPSIPVCFPACELHVAEFPLLLAGKLRRLIHLKLTDTDWITTTTHNIFFTSLLEFTSVTTLRLVRVHFRSLCDFGRIVCALPSLSSFLQISQMG